MEEIKGRTKKVRKKICSMNHGKTKTEEIKRTTWREHEENSKRSGLDMKQNKRINKM